MLALQVTEEIFVANHLESGLLHQGHSLAEGEVVEGTEVEQNLFSEEACRVRLQKTLKFEDSVCDATVVNAADCKVVGSNHPP